MRFSLAARMPLSPLFSTPGGTGTPARAWTASCDTKGLGGRCARWVLCWLWGRLAPSWLGSRALLRIGGHHLFPTLLRRPWNHLPESQRLLQEYEDHLVFQFPTFPEYAEAGLQIFCHLTFPDKSHRRNTVCPTSPDPCPFAGLTDHRWGHASVSRVCADFQMPEKSSRVNSEWLRLGFENYLNLHHDTPFH